MTRAGYRNYVLGVLVLVNMFNFIDRNIVSVLLQQIKDDFQTSDAQMGLLTGMAFVVVHGLFGIPIARWADRGSRRVVIATGVAVWSAMTALSGLANRFAVLLALRMGVGIGEAAGTPPSHSMISDYFPLERRARALSVYAMGLYLGIMFGYLVAGWLGQYFGWRITLIAVGLPGLALAALILATVKEPPRTTNVESHPFPEVVGFLLRRPAWLALLVAGSFHAAVGYSINIWAPTFLLRVHGMSYGELGTWLGLLTGIFGGAGALAGGAIADRLGSRDQRWYAWTAGLAALAALPTGAIFVMAGSKWVALASFAPLIFVIGIYTGPIYAMNQNLAKPRMRATGIAVHLLVVSIVGGGVAPWLLGELNDALRPTYGEAGIRYSLLVVIAAGTLVAATAYAIASRTIRADVEAARQ
jgi:predicted MFS family arabinose efflux permease